MSSSEDRNWADEYYGERIRQVSDRAFIELRFEPQSALVARQSEGGYRHVRLYDGEPFDESRFELVDRAWDHEHCFVCGDRIEPGMVYWLNQDAQCFCRVCAVNLSQTEDQR